MAIPSILFLVALLPVPESPRWLVSAGQIANAEQVLTKLGNEPHRVEEIRAALAEEAGAKLLQPRLRRPLAIGMLLAIFQQVTGINTILYYGSGGRKITNPLSAAKGPATASFEAAEQREAALAIRVHFCFL